MMAALRQFIARLRAFARGGDLDREFAEEMAAHLEMATEENVRKGMTRERARREAALRLGGTSSLQSQHRDVRGFRFLDDLVQDLRFAGRLMRKDRWFSTAAIAAIALGIGANAVGFTIVNAAFIRGFGFEHAEQLRAISWRPDRGRRTPSSYADLEDWRSQSHSFSAIGAYSFGAHNISDDHAPPEQTQGALVTADLFEVLRQRPLLGRSFMAGDDRRGAEPVVLIGYEMWTNRFGRDPNVIGRLLRINGAASTIVGVMPERMKFPENSELWVPFAPTDAQLARDARLLGVIARLKDGVSAREAATDIDGIARRIIAAHPDQSKGVVGAQIETLVQRFMGGMARPMFVTVMGAVTFVLLIACANVANLLLSRAMYRGREVAVRYSLGATRWRIIRQLLIESIALSCIGGVIGVILASVAIDAFDAAVQMADPPYWLHFTIDYRVLVYVAGSCIATGIVFGLAPAMHVSRDSQHETLKESARGTTGNRRAGRFGYALVVGELALTVVLLCGAGLMLRSFVSLYTLDPGFAVDGLMRMRMQLPPAKYPTPESRARFFDQLQSRVGAIPGITGSAFTTNVPPLDGEEWRFEIDGRPLADNDKRPFVATVTITPDYFEVLGVNINRGRALTANDGAPGAESAVISQVMADRYFRGEDPIGRRIRFVPREGEPEESRPWRTIVGVSAPFLQGSTDEAFRSAVVYLPFRQLPPRTSSLVIRSVLPPPDVMAAVRGAVQSIDIDQPVFTIETVDAVIQNERLFHRIFAAVFGLLAAIALTLSAVGVYGVMAYAVTQRTQEIGVRMAIGAQRWHVAWMFLKRCLTQLALGLAIGLPGAMLLGQVVRFNLVEIEPGDPVTIVTITAVLIAVALLSCLVPLRKASRVDPMNALRSE
ncbi:MAG TPA: ABC transporter permease [Vicinamibacterales bacterium]|nr:ABC transporter permease [Vicinamibacterales bacterium]